MTNNKNIDIYFYKINFYDLDKDIELVETGFCAGIDYSSITKNICKFYGEESILKLETTCITDGVNPIVVVDNQIIEEIIKKNNY